MSKFYRLKEYLNQKEAVTLFDVAVVTLLAVTFIAINLFAKSNSILLTFFITTILYLNLRYRIRKPQ
jgi:uncharacterized membrane protein YfhO